MTRRLARETEWDFDRFSQFLKEGGEPVYTGGRRRRNLNRPRCRKLCGNTWVYWRSANKIQIDYYAITILVFYRDGMIDLDMGGWETTTTKERVNSFSPLSVWKEKGKWYVAPDASCFTSKKQHPPVFLYDCCFARFYPDHRRSPTDVAGEPLLRRSVHERQCRLLKEAERRDIQRAAARHRKMKKYAAWLWANTTLDYVFKDWTTEQRGEILKEMRTIVSTEKASEIKQLRLELRLAQFATVECDEEIIELKAKLVNRTIDKAGHDAVIRERIIDL